MRAHLTPIFGTVPDSAENLEIVGVFPRRYEQYRDAVVWPWSGVVRRPDGRIEAEAIWIEAHLKQCGDYHSKWSWLPQRKPGKYFNLSLFWWPNYYHWMCDVLPRLKEVLPRLESGIKVILPPRLAAWQRRSLVLVGLKENQCVEYGGRRPWKVEELLFVPPVAMTGDHEPVSLHWVRDTLRGQLGCTPSKPGWRKLYVTRKTAVSRRIVNEAELIPLLKERGVEVVDCGELTLDEQVKLFAEAAWVVGAHGAAFANILWAPTGLKVCEIFEPGSVRRCYWSMSQALGHAHFCGIGRSVVQAQGEPNLEVPVAEFRKVLELMN